ncbi:tRNA(Met) cytidine acetyltransferase [Thalassomonas sp. M1454]|nr:tRNA(Met) cytidine acetyltransferase [Thalassomonas sp. M1454]
MRSMLIFIGEQEWLNKQIEQHISESKSANFLFFSDKLASTQSNTELEILSSDHYVHNKNYRQYLGTEQDLILFEAFDDFNIDAFAALSGTVVAGGLLVLTINKNLFNNSEFVRYFINKAEGTDSIYVFNQNDNEQSFPVIALDTDKSENIETLPLNFACKTYEQQQAVEKILRVVSGHRDRPLVLTADRGRGKSTALALAAVELLQQDNKQIIITTSHSESLAIFFKQLEISLPQAKTAKHSVSLGTSNVKFVPLDVLLKQKPSCHLLMVDEAAGVPLPILRLLLSNYHRQVFVSTIHGYEGAGRGFSTKFIKELQQLKPQSQHFHINQPIRWARGDYLESFTFDSLLLDATLPKVCLQQNVEIEYKNLSGSQLLLTPGLLTQVFSLLVSAHYQTKPSDLKMLLDNERVRLVLQIQNEQLLGVVFLLAEGDIEQALSADIKHSLRRIKGHFTPQSLLVHCAVEQAFEYNYQRIVRIAIHPELQQLGLGHKLIAQCKRIAIEQGSDFISSSFGANAQLLNFWLSNDFSIARIGFSKDKASGEHSALVLQALNSKSDVLLKSISNQFNIDFQYLMSDEYQYLPTELMLLILQQLPNPYLSLDDQQVLIDQQTVSDFALGYRVFSCCAPALQRKFLALLQQGKVSNLEQSLGYKLMIRKVIQQQSWSEIYAEFNLTGKKQTMQLMKEFSLYNWSVK